MEPQQNRLNRFKNGSPVEVISTLLNSIDNFFNKELKETLLKQSYPQEGLMFLGVHASILTIGEVFWGLKPKKTFKKFHQIFIDGSEEHLQFSRVADQIHKWRNVLAHQWLSPLGYKILSDYTSEHGWKLESDGRLRINPEIYLNLYLGAFGPEGKIWNYVKHFSPSELEEIKKRMLKKYLFQEKS